MRGWTVWMLAVAALVTLAGPEARADDKPHIVFLIGDEEYRSEESMPMLAKILHRDHGFRITLCFSLNDEGFIDPNATDNIAGIEALADADLMVLFTRFRDLPPEQFEHFLSYVNTGKPIVGFRTATHAFRFQNHPQYEPWGWKGEKIAQLLGQNWITHHGHFGDGHEHLTKVWPIKDRKDHPILRGVEPFMAYSWLYHVEGNGTHLRGDAEPLAMGRALKSKAKDRGFPLTNPVAWTKTYQGESGQTGRVFFMTTAHPFDFKAESARKLALNGILWALGMERKIPPDGCRADIAGEYDPNNSGFSRGGKIKYKQGLQPRDVRPE